MAGEFTMYQLLEFLSQLTSTSPQYMGLFANNFAPDYNTTLGDLTECTWAGYAQQGLPLTAAYDAGGGVAETDSSSTINFGPLSDSSSNDVYGFFVVDGGGNLLYAERFESAPITVSPGLPTLGVNGHWYAQNLF